MSKKKNSQKIKYTQHRSVSQCTVVTAVSAQRAEAASARAACGRAKFNNTSKSHIRWHYRIRNTVVGSPEAGAHRLVPPLATTGLPRTPAHAAGLPPPTPHANTGRRLSKSIMRADSRQHTRHPRACFLTEHIPPCHAEKGAACSVGVEATSCGSKLLAALTPLERHGLSRMQVDWGCETPGRSEVWLEEGAGEASHTPLSEIEEREVEDGAGPAEHEHVERELVVKLRHWR
jgi:hypothetical protein